jgi:uncharacterized protein YprB with RNaseH-like and TPR domain
MRIDILFPLIAVRSTSHGSRALDLKQRLTALHSQTGGGPSSTPEPVGHRLQRLHGAARPATTRDAHEVEVARLLAGERIAAGVIMVEQQLPLSHQHGKRCLGDLRTQAYILPPMHRPLPAEGLIFMDTETTGLAGGTGTLAFVLGLGRLVGEALCLRQFFLTGFRGEASLLQAAKTWIAGAKYLVTFNGKSFDAPLLATRYRLASLGDPFTELQHVDLFHPTRRAFGNQWPNCRLQTAERRLLGFQRHDDLPAHLIPEAWFAFVRHGATHHIPRILGHNRCDLMSLAVLLPALSEAFVTPGANGADVVAVARYWLQQGDEQTALAHLQAQQDRLPTAGLLDLARLYRRRQAWESAVSIWHRLARQNCLEALERLAKYYEHVRGDPHTALHLTGRLRLLDRANKTHAQRERRLMAKLSRP